MKKLIKVKVVGSSQYYADFIENRVLVDDIKNADIVLFTGGEDVDPSVYGCEKHNRTYSNIKRDNIEKDVFKQINPEKQIAVGICRGSQLMCALNGGILIQDCDHHALGGTHQIVNKRTGEVFNITSTHHQMQYPYHLPSSDYEVLYVAYGNRCSYYEGDKINVNPLVKYGEPEIVLYKKKGNPKCLAIQGHPEFMGPCGTVTMLNELIEKILEK
jgi:anthranilate/para-aminobenzoate synthase component II